jgi:hypothetical protein
MTLTARCLGFAVLLLLLAARTARASDPDAAAMARVFAALEKAHRANDAAAFAARWHPEGFRKNLVGGSGTTGESAFRQGARKHWFLRPDLDKLAGGGRGGPWLVPCDVWSWDKEQAVDHVDALLVWHDGQWLVLGAGEKRAEVEALGRRWADKEPLEPPPR